MPLPLRENIYRVRNLPRTDAILMGRAELLSPEDHDLIEAVLIHSQSTGAVSRMMKVSPRVIRKRLHMLGRRLTSRKFLDAARALPYMSEDKAELARLHFCQGIAQRQLSERLGMSNHAIRRELDRLSAEISAIGRMSRNSRPPAHAHASGTGGT